MTRSNARPRAKVQEGISRSVSAPGVAVVEGERSWNDAMASVLAELGAPLSGIRLSGGHPSLSAPGSVG